MTDAIDRLQTSFVSGVLSPRLWGRVDLDKYASGCSDLTNFVVIPQGGITRRPGTRYIATAKTAGKKIRLVPFQFSITQTYMLEFGHNYIRFYADGGQVVDGSDVPVEVTTTYTEAELPYLRFAQSADVLYITHPAHAPAMLSRTSATAFSLADVTWTFPPFNSENASAITLTCSATTGTVDITFSGAGFSKGGVGLTQDHVGMYLYVYTYSGSPLVATAKGLLKIKTVTSATIGTADVIIAPPGTSAYTYWAEGAFNAVYGYPRLCTFYEDRLVFASSTDFPQRIWLSCTGDYYNFEYGTDDDDAIARSINVDQVNHIVWLKSGKKLYYGTVGGEGHLSSGSTANALTPTNVTSLMESRYGSTEGVDAVLIGNETLFLQRGGKTVRRYAYDYASDAFSGENMSILAEHLTRTTTIVEMAYQQEPYGIVWAVTAEGNLLGLTYLPEHKVAAWHKHTTEGIFESVATIPGATDDELWVSVKRTVGGVDLRYIECMDPFFAGDDDDLEDACFVDSCLTYDGAAATSISGLLHLAGKTAAILGDGAVISSRAVSAAGVLALPYSRSVVQIGLGYVSTVATMPAVLVGSGGQVVGKKKKIDELEIKFDSTHGCKVSADGVTYDTVHFPLVDNEVTLFTGDKDVPFPGFFDRNAIIYLEQDLPLPCTILSLMPSVEVDK